MAFAKLSLIGLCFAVLSTGCYRFLPSDGGGQTDFSSPREVNAADVAVPPGYVVDVVATHLTFPTGIAFDNAGAPYVVESGYAYGEVWTEPKLFRINTDSSLTEIARGGRNGPWNGVTYDGEAFFVAEGGQLEGGRIVRISLDGKVSSVVDNLPSLGDHHTNGPVVGPDGKLYFGQGTATNSGVVGVDNYDYGWLARFPTFHDTPCKDIVLSGQNFETPNPLKDGADSQVRTGAFSPFGAPTKRGQIVEGALPCSGAITRLNTDGTELELVAWGFRNPFGLAFSPEGELYITENGYDVRGSRPVWGSGDYLWRVQENTWYGWPDYAGGMALDREYFAPPRKAQPVTLLAEHPNRPPQPTATFGVHASANGIDFSRTGQFGFQGQAFVAEFGDLSPGTGKSLHPVGYRVVRVDPETGHITDFATNKPPQSGPASKLGTAGLERPVSVRFDNSGTALYIVDFGVMLTGEKGPVAIPGTGVVWRIRPEEL
mgnify:CR=1 FL=1